MGASCGVQTGNSVGVHRAMGLIDQHAYSILNICQLESHRLLRLRNPWGQGVIKIFD
jgi:hypothetical protein